MEILAWLCMGICVPSTHPKACGKQYLFFMPWISSFISSTVVGNFLYLEPKTSVIMLHTFLTTTETTMRNCKCICRHRKRVLILQKYWVMTSCFSTDNPSSPLGLLPCWRNGWQSSTTDTKTAWFILKFFFHSISGKITLNKLSYHCSVLLQLLHVLPQQIITAFGGSFV